MTQIKQQYIERNIVFDQQLEELQSTIKQLEDKLKL